MPWLINSAQLDKFRKGQKNVAILDASLHLPTANRNAHEEFLERHIQGARFLNLADFHDKTSFLPNMLIRDEKVLSEKMANLGITHEYKIIFYDQSELHSSCRALWMFKTLGHHPQSLYILDGGFAAWEKYGGKVETGEPRQIAAKPYKAQISLQFLRTLIQMKSNVHHPTEQVVDLRHPIRFTGGPELRPNVRRGHIPRSFSFPYFTMFDAEGRFKSIERLRKQLIGIGLELNIPITTLCGSGITAAILNFILDLLGQENNALYDGSWSEWGYDQLYSGESSIEERPVVTSLDA